MKADADWKLTWVRVNTEKEAVNILEFANTISLDDARKISGWVRLGFRFTFSRGGSRERTTESNWRLWMTALNFVILTLDSSAMYTLNFER